MPLLSKVFAAQTEYNMVAEKSKKYVNFILCVGVCGGVRVNGSIDKSLEKLLYTLKLFTF